MSGVYHWVCSHCGVVGEEHARMGKEEVVVSVESRGSSGVRFVGGNKETQKKVSEVSGAGLEPAHLAPAILVALAGRAPDSPFAHSKIVDLGGRMLGAILAAGKKPSVGGVEKLVAGCVYYAAAEASLDPDSDATGGTNAQLTGFVEGVSAVIADRLGGGTGTKATTSVVKSVGEVRKALARADLQHMLPSSADMDMVAAERAVRAYLAPLDATANGDPAPKTGMGAVYAWGRASAMGAWGGGMDASVKMAPALRELERALARVVLDCQKWTQRNSVGENRNHTTHWAAFASLVVEAFAAMGETRGAPDVYYRGKKSDSDPASGLLVSPKYTRVNPEFSFGALLGRVASGALRLAVAAAATNKAGGLKRPRPKKGDPEPLRPFPPRGRLLALNQKSVGQAVKDFVEEVRHYRRDLNQAVLRNHGLYLPRESYWKERGLRNLGVQG